MPERTRIEIWADPKVTRNFHRFEVEAAATRFEAVMVVDRMLVRGDLDGQAAWIRVMEPEVHLPEQVSARQQVGTLV